MPQKTTQIVIASPMRGMCDSNQVIRLAGYCAPCIQVVLCAICRTAALDTISMIDTSDSQKIEDGRRFLAEHGLNLFAVLDCNALPADVRKPMSESMRFSDYSRLVIIGNAGARFWQVLQSDGPSPDHPIDSFSRSITQSFCSRYLEDEACEMIYPGNFPIPLQRIGTLLGWGEVSPLGIGISNEYGLWFAYRAAFFTTAELPLSEKSQQLRACDSCVDKPCISHCPASAVSASTAFDIPACVNFRLSENSPCVDRCLARQACPVGVEYRYPEEMVQYLYEYSIKSIRRRTNSASAADQ